MNYFDLMRMAQGGRAMSNLASRFGLSENQAASAVQHVLPSITGAVAKNTASQEGLGSLLGALSSGKHERYFDDPTIFMDGSARKDGENILGHVLGSSDAIENAAQKAAAASGVSGAVIKQMMPYVAAIYMGSLFKSTKGPLDGLLGQVAGGAVKGALGGGGSSFGVLSKLVSGVGSGSSLASQASGLLNSSTNRGKGIASGLLGGIFGRKG